MKINNYMSEKVKVRVLTIGANMAPRMIDPEKLEHPVWTKDGDRLEVSIYATRCAWGHQLGTGDSARTWYPDSAQEPAPGARALLLGQVLFAGVHRTPGGPGGPGLMAVYGVISMRGVAIDEPMRALSLLPVGILIPRMVNTSDTRWPKKVVFSIDPREKIDQLPVELREGGNVRAQLIARAKEWASAWGPAPWEAGRDPQDDIWAGIE